MKGEEYLYLDEWNNWHVASCVMPWWGIGLSDLYYCGYKARDAKEIYGPLPKKLR